MQSFYDYDVIIFDCDGVILDSNNLKIKAMEAALLKSNFPKNKIKKSIKFFNDNFGMSRFYHVDYFVKSIEENLLSKEHLKEKILENYSLACVSLYKTSNFTEGFVEFVDSLNAKLYVASGSEQEELRKVFKDKRIDSKFHNMLGSPASKSQNVSRILSENNNKKNIVLIGDAMSDFEAATKNNIDFIFYSPYSNIKDKMIRLSKSKKFTVINSYAELLNGI